MFLIHLYGTKGGLIGWAGRRWNEGPGAEWGPALLFKVDFMPPGDAKLYISELCFLLY